MNIEVIKSLLTLRVAIAFVVGLAIGFIIVEKGRQWRQAWKLNKQQQKKQ